MALPISQATRQSLAKIKKEPVLVVEFDGIDTRLGSAIIYRYIQIGDPGLLVGGGWKIGGKVALGDQIDAITFSSDFGTTTTTIDFKLDPDKGRGESVTSMTLAFLDNKANDILGIVADYEMLGRKVRILLAPDPTDTVYPDDYIVIFRGIIESIELPPGGVVFVVSHPDQKKRQSIYNSVEASLASPMDDNDTTATLQPGEAAQFLQRINGPDGSPDTSFTGYVEIDDEIMRYTGVSGDQLTGITRAQFGTTAAAHEEDAGVASFYRLQGDVLDLALKLMLSGIGGPFVTDVVAKSFNYINVTDTVANTIFFQGIDVTDRYGLSEGDFVTTTGAANGANNVTLKEITDITVTGDGSYIEVDGVSFVDEQDTTGVVAFRSKYDSLPDGMGMGPDEVDVAEHERIADLFLTGFEYDFYLRDSIENGKEFMEQQLYSPIACYSTPRKARSSVAYTIGPLPTDAIVTLDSRNVKNADKLVKRRGIGKNFYNTIIYKYNESAYEDGKFLNGVIETDATSRTMIPVGTRAMTISAKGLRSGVTATNAASRRLARYAFGAEYFDNVKILFAAGYSIEVGDLVILDGESLMIADRQTGERSTPARFYEVVAKKIALENGDITLSLLDTKFDGSQRYALISPASLVRDAISESQFNVKSSFASRLGNDEYLKWQRYGEITVRVRTQDYSVAGTGVIDRWQGNTVFLKEELGFTPSADMVMELSDYNDANAEIKLLYAFIAGGSGVNFDDGEPPYQMI